MTRHQRMKRTMRSPARQAKRRKRVRREYRWALIEMFRNDDRLVAPAWLRNEVYGQQVHRPAAMVLVTST